MRLILVRHGESEHNRLAIHNANETQLSALGREQARLVAARLAHEHIDKAYTSTLPRAIDTAKAILEHHADVKLIQDARIREKDNGVVAGKPYGTRTQLAAQQGIPEEHYAPEGGESPNTVHKRVEAFISELHNEPQTDTILIVSHGGPLAQIISSFVHKPAQEFTKANTGVTIIDVDVHRKATLHVFNSTDHLF